MKPRSLYVRLLFVSLVIAAAAAFVPAARASGYIKALDSVQEFLGLTPAAPSIAAPESRSTAGSEGTLVHEAFLDDQAPLFVTDPGPVVYGTSPTLATTGGSGTGAVTFSHGTSPGCTVTAGGVLTVTNANALCSITATKAGDATFNPVTSAPLTVTLVRATPVVEFGPPPTPSFPDAPDFSIGATTTPPGLTLTYSVVSGSCVYTTGTNFTATAAGNCTIRATSTETINYESAFADQIINILLVRYTITASVAGGNGTISPSGSVRVDGGQNQTFVFTPNAGFQVATILVDGSPVTDANSYQFENVRRDHTIVVSFEPASCHTLTGGSVATFTGASIVVPVNLSQTAVLDGLISADFDLVYDPAVIRATHTIGNFVSVTIGPAATGGFVIASETAGTPGTIHFSVFDTSGFETVGGDALVLINFTVVGQGGTHSATTIPPSAHFGNAGIGDVCANVVAGDVTVGTRNTTTAVTTSGNSTYGDAVTFTATITASPFPVGSPPVSGGSVTFYDGGTDCTTHGAAIGLPVSLTGNTAQLITSTLTAATRNIVACYSGSTNFASSSGLVQHTVVRKPVAPAVTAANKVYDGNTTATIATCTIPGKVGTDDVACLAAGPNIFGNKNVGTGRAVAATNISLTGTTAANYTLTTTSAATTANITPKPVTPNVTAASRVYDGTTAASITACTLATVVVGDDAACSAAGPNTFVDRNAGTGKTVTALGIAITGTTAGNYSLSATTATTTANITPLDINITAVTSTKVYDGTLIAPGTPTVVPALIAPDTATLVQAFRTKHVGTNKTIAPSALINDGNGGSNYTQHPIPVSTGVITARPITVTAATQTRVYDGTTVSTSIPAVTTGSIAVGDTGNFTQTFNTKHVGTGKTLTAAGGVTDGNAGANYAVTFVTNTTGVITARAITVTAVTSTKAYDGNTTSTGIPTVTTGTIATGDTPAFTQAYANRNVGTGKTLNAAGTVNDGNSGSNYTVTFVANATGVITARALTVTAVTDTKSYDGTTSSAATPSITTGTLIGGDTAAFTQTFDTKHVGTGKTMTATGTVSDGNAGGNYAVTFVTNTTGVITARAIQVTAATDTKVYDGTTTSAGIPTVTTGSLATGDTATFTQSFANRNVGTATTINAAGTVNDGNGGSNYTVTFVASTTGVITARPLTVAAAADTKVYDGTTTSTATPAVTTGTLVGGDTGTFTQTFDTKHVGTGKTMTAAGSVSDGNGGNNYSVSFVASANGVITVRSIQVTAVTSTKVYDGGTTSTGTPTITLGSLATGDTAGFTQAFDTKHVGTAKTITATGVVVDGNSGNNYAVTFVANSSGVITQLAITVSATASTKTYDGAVTSAGIPTVTTGALVGGDTAVFSQTYDNRNAGTGKTLTPTGTITDGNSGGNYLATYTPVNTGVINKLSVTVTAVATTKTYDGNTSSTGIPTVSPALIVPDTGSFSQTYDNANAGTGKVLTPIGTITDGNGGNNYAATFATVATGVITPAAAVCTVTPYSVPYDTIAHTATGTCAGVLSEDLSLGLNLTNTTHTDPGTYAADFWFFTSPNGNYNNIANTTITDAITTGALTGTVTNIIANKPVPDVTVTGNGTLVVTGTTALPNGAYSVTGFGAGTYSFTAAKTQQACATANGVTSDDASMVSEYVVGLTTFTATQQAAAHVSSVTTSISSLDAALIAQKAVADCHANNRAGEWVFDTGNLAPTIMGTDKVDDFTGYMMGDVDGDWSETGANRSMENSNPSANAVIGSLPTVQADAATRVTVPFRIDNLAGKSVRSTQFTVTYDPAVVEAVVGAASVQGTSAASLGVVSNVPTPGILKVAVYGAMPASGDGVYVNLTFTVRGAAGASTPLSISGFRFNANTDEVTSVDGQLTVRTANSGATLNGRLVSADGRGIGRARVAVTSTNGTTFTATSSRTGQFVVTGLVLGETYTVTVSTRRYAFSPQSISLSQNSTDIELIGDLLQ